MNCLTAAQRDIFGSFKNQADFGKSVERCLSNEKLTENSVKKLTLYGWKNCRSIWASDAEDEIISDHMNENNEIFASLQSDSETEMSDDLHQIATPMNYFDTSVIQTPKINFFLYVDSQSGNNLNQGTSETSPLKTIWKAISLAKNNTKILVKNGIYTNINFGQGKFKKLFPAANIKNLNNLVLKNFDSNHRPVIKFDGSAGINIDNGHFLEISGFEIIGPAYEITKKEALSDRIKKRSVYMNGRGLVIWSGTHIKISNIIIHGAPGCGLRANQADYIIFENNTIFNNTWWTSHGEAGIVLAESKNSDEKMLDKMFILNNKVFNNIKRIPFYSPHMQDQDYLNAHQMEEARPGYGSKTAKFIIDGPGISLTRNSHDNFYGKKYGGFVIANNQCYKNGINGISVHKTENVKILNNVIWNNGQVPKFPAVENRQPFAGITINNSDKFILIGNFVTTELDGDYAYVWIQKPGKVHSVESKRVSSKTSFSNKVCQGKVMDEFIDVVQQLDEKYCDLGFEL